jgi:hypothetical protein
MKDRVTISKDRFNRPSFVNGIAASTGTCGSTTVNREFPPPRERRTRRTQRKVDQGRGCNPEIPGSGGNFWKQ